MTAEAGYSFADVGRMTLPQLMCLASADPPSTGRKFTSLAAFEAEVGRLEAAWNAPQ